MPVAGFLGPLQALTPPAPMAGAPAAVAATSSNSVHGFTRNSNSSQSGAGPRSAPVWRLYMVCTTGRNAAWLPAVLAPLDCCGPDASGSRNQTSSLDTPCPWSAISITGPMDSTGFCDGSDRDRQTTAASCRIVWAGGGAHFVALGGWLVSADSSQYVNVLDPIYGPRSTPISFRATCLRTTAGKTATSSRRTPSSPGQRHDRIRMRPCLLDRGPDNVRPTSSGV